MRLAEVQSVVFPEHRLDLLLNGRDGQFDDDRR
jgi:hypothetical protein